MQDQKFIKPDFLFEVSWEVCNMVGGIYTVIATKAQTLAEEYGDSYILIGPEAWKEASENPDFLEDKHIYRSWTERAETEGLHFRIGRWNIPGSPVVILVDFTPYFSSKDLIFTEFWKMHKLDSLSGQWDYIEPALFGYAAGKVIESFYEFTVNSKDRILAHFHEWMTGTGLLYLKEKTPQIGCLFTTHATVVGRSIAGNGMPLYKDMMHYQGDATAVNLGVSSKHSLEKLAAIESDAFTTVSEITSKECSCFLEKEVDVVTPNGFSDSFLPLPELQEKTRSVAREKLFSIAEALTCRQISRDSLLVIHSGRYEFRNKGIDLFLDALGTLNNKEDLPGEIIAFITVPANHTGPRKDLLERMAKPDFTRQLEDKILTHGLHDYDFDVIIKRIRENGLGNLPGNKVNVIFVPSYLDGSDGILNMTYYELLSGFDVSVFPSYYEPWGYTPLESIAFRVPTVTTTLAGFGLWLKEQCPDCMDGTRVIERNDENAAEVVVQIADALLHSLQISGDARVLSREKVYRISRKALWSNLIDRYEQAFLVALQKVEQRAELFAAKQPFEHYTAMGRVKIRKPEWKKVFINSELPESLAPLQALSRNLWWTWNFEAVELFEMINPERWHRLGNNPIALIESLTINELSSLIQNLDFMEQLRNVFGRFEEYMGKTSEKPLEMVAYFSMEYGIHDVVKIFSGGLGILAGDFLKEASDSNANIVAVGLMYRYGYFIQTLSVSGEQISTYQPQKQTLMPLIPVRNDQGEWVMVKIALPGRTLHAKVWRLDVGRIPLYLLDTDVPENIEADRTITHQLYGGDWENRFKQELLLGVGGIRLLDALNIRPDIFHINEGHAAFIGVERLRAFVQNQNFSFNQAMEIVRASQLFTTHTPVPAGHDSFHEDILRTYIPHYADRLNISWEAFMNLGRMEENNPDEKFSMSMLAAKLCQEMNGVSRIHQRVTREMFNGLYEGFFPNELHIGYITNGVHYHTWTAKKWQVLYEREFGEDFLSQQYNKDHWKKIRNVPAQSIWNIRQAMRKKLIDFVKVRLNEEMTRRQENPKMILQILESFNDKALTIGFARRFATYKRAHLLFTNLEHLQQILNNKEKPVQLIFAGKAHPQDKAGQDLIRRIVDISKTPGFLGKITFIENYDMELARKLVQGVDIWLNTPTRPMEASGTSGQKAALNGVLNLSVLDGWWAEGYRPEAGWALKEERTYTNQVFQDELDAETIYNLLEDEIIPLFYSIDNERLPSKWIQYVKNAVAEIAPEFTMKRMLDEYQEKFYRKLIDRSNNLKKNDYELARKISAWKRKMINSWDSLEIRSLNVPDSSSRPLDLGEVWVAEITLGLNELSAKDLGIEILFGQKVNDEVKDIVFLKEMDLVCSDRQTAVFRCEIAMSKAGVYDYVFRVFPKNPLLPHRQDFNLVKWI